MIKVLTVFTTAFVPTGGLTTVMMNYYRVLDKSLVHIDFASTNTPPQQLLDEIHLSSSQYYKLPPREKKLRYLQSLKKITKEYDIVHVHGNSSTSILELLAARLAGVKKRIVHNHNSITSHPLINKILNPFFRMSYTHAIACSSLAGNWLFGKNQFYILRNAIAVDRFAYNEDCRNRIRQELGVPQNNVVLGHVGKFVKAKNHLFLIDVFAKHLSKCSNSTLLLVGDGPCRQEIEAEIKKRNLSTKVVLAGLRTDTPALLSAMDCFVFPSLWEGLPLSVLEAQASGLPCFLSTNITKEVGLTPDTRFVELSKTAAQWAALLTFSNPVDRNEKCRSNKELLTASGYNILHESQSLLKIYLE